MSKILVSPVAYNEIVKLKNAIERFINSCVFNDVDYLIVDDGSDDGTSAMIQTFQKYRVNVIRHDSRKGVGAAIRTAIDFAKENKYDILVIMAGNDKDNPNEIPNLIDPIVKDDYDIVQGSRYKGHCGIGGDMPLYRKIATRIHPLFFSYIAKTKVTDSTNGFRAMRVSMLSDDHINLHQPWLDKYELEPYLLFKVIKLGYKFTEAQVTKIYPPKKLGYTKMRPFIDWWSILRPLVYLWLGVKK